MKKKDAYQDILHLPHYRSDHRAPMPVHKRAAQFAPFDALSGFGAVIRELSRFKEQRIFTAEDQEEELDRAIHCIQKHLHLQKQPLVGLTAFFPMEESEYGCYRTETVRVVNLDLSQRILVTEDGNQLTLDDIIHIVMV